MAKDSSKFKKSIVINPQSAPANPEKGEIYYDEALDKLQVYNGTTFENSGGVIVKDEGSILTDSVSEINFTGTGVTATVTGDVVTVNVPATAVQDEGITLTPNASNINFTGMGVTATNTGSNVTVNVPSVPVQDEGVTVTNTPSLINFTGAGVTASATGNAVTVNIPGGGGGANIAVQDEGITLTPTVASFNFVGAGVTATAIGNDVTIDVPTTASKFNGSSITANTTSLDFVGQGITASASVGDVTVYIPNDLKNLIDNGDAQKNTNPSLEFTSSVVGRVPSGTQNSGAAQLALVRSTTLPLDGIASYLLTKDAANAQGQNISFPFTITEANMAKVMQINFDYKVSAGTFTAGSRTTDSDVIVYIYDVTNNTYIEPSSIKLLASPTTFGEKFQASFQTSATGSSYRLLFHVATTTANGFTLQLDNIVVKPEEYVYGTPVTDEAPYTPTIVGFGTVTSVDFKWNRVGDKIRVRGRFITGTPAATQASISLPSGFSIDLGKVSNAFYSTIGFGQNSGASVADFGTKLILGRGGDTTVAIGRATSTSDTSQNPQLGSNLAGTTQDFRVLFEVPISGLSSSVQTSDQTDTRIVDFVASATTAQAVTANVTNIDYTVVDKDSHASFNNATNEYVIPVAGDYQASATFTSNQSQSGVFYVNGVAKYRISSAAANAAASGSVLLPNLKVGDIISLRTNVTGTIVADANAFISISRISGPSAIAASELVAASYYVSASVAYTANTPVNFDGKEYDSHNAVTTGAGVWKFTAPIGGTYVIHGAWNSNATAENISLFKNGTIYKNAGGYTSTQGANGTFTTTLRMLAGDFVDIRANNSAAALAGGALNGVNTTNINIARLGL